MYLATNTTSMTLEFEKGNLEASIVDSLQSQSVVQTLVCPPSLLRGCWSTPMQQHSCSPIHQTKAIPQIQLYCNALACNMLNAKGNGRLHKEKAIVLLKPLVFQPMQSHGAIGLLQSIMACQLLQNAISPLSAPSSIFYRTMASIGPNYLLH
jgi:hypothetical protein